jgi:hypothetical protein
MFNITPQAALKIINNMLKNDLIEKKRFWTRNSLYIKKLEEKFRIRY